MRKLAGILILVFAFTLTTNAQHKDKKQRKSNFTVDQKTTLAVKKMTLALNLTEKQQNQMKPLIASNISDRMSTMNGMKKMKESGKKPTDDEKYAFANAHLDKKIAFKNKVKQILNDDQFDKFEKMSKKRTGKMKKGMKKKGMKKMRKNRNHKNNN